MDELLTIGQLAERTGVQPGTLRMWEQRHGFPHAERLPSGHRRYRASEAQRVLDVVAAREAGMSLPGAVERATAEERSGPDAPSIFAGLRQLRPELAPYPVPKRLLIPISHALEDECSTRGGGAVLVGSFQRERFYRQAEERWRSFAHTAELDHRARRLPAAARSRRWPDRDPHRPQPPAVARVGDRLRRPRRERLSRGRERPGTNGKDGQRVFEMLWSVEPEVVRDAARLGIELAAEEWPELSERVPAWLSGPPESDDSALARATSVTNRMLAYIAAAS